MLVQPICMRKVQAMRTALVNFQTRSGDERGSRPASKLNRRGSVSIAVDNQRRTINSLQLTAEIRRSLDPVEFGGRQERCLCHHLHRPINNRARGFRREVRLRIRLRPAREIGRERLTELIEGCRFDPDRVVRSFEQERYRGGGDEHEPVDPVRSVPRQVPNYLSAGEGMPDESQSGEVELLNQSCKIFRQGVEVETASGIA